MFLPQTIDELQREWNNPYIQWYAAGMPAFNTQNLSPHRQLKVKFRTKEDREHFAQVTSYPLTDKTNVVWYPFKDRERNNMNRIVEE